MTGVREFEAAESSGEIGCSRPFRLGRWRVDPQVRELSDGENHRRLSPRAMGILSLLVEADGGVVRRDDLLEAIWPDVVVGEESVTTAVSELRRALGDKRGDGARLIDTVQKTGYRLTVRALPDTPEPLATFTDDPAGFEAYLMVLDARNLRWAGDLQAIEEAARLCDEARRLAPGFAPAHAHFAATASFVHFYGGEAILPDAEAAAETAVRLRPDLSLSHATQGFALYAAGRHMEARRAFGRAILCCPNDFDTHSFARYAFFGMGDWRAAASLAERASEIQPDDFVCLSMAARAAEATGDCRRATALALRAAMRAQAHLKLQPDNPRTRPVLACLHAMLGDVDKAERYLDAPVEPGTANSYFGTLALVRLGAFKTALDRLEDFAHRGWRHANFLANEPLLAPLRQDRRFGKLLKAMAA